MLTAGTRGLNPLRRQVCAALASRSRAKADRGVETTKSVKGAVPFSSRTRPSMFAHIQEAPMDPILGTSLLYQADKDPKKINLGVGAYRTADGKPYILPIVRKAEEELLAELGTGNNKEYSTIDGPANLKTACQKLIFGESAKSIADGRIASAQSLSGTGALRVVSEFIKTHLPVEAHTIYSSNPTWGNHHAIFKAGGLTGKPYPYWDPETKGLDFDGMIATLGSAPEGSSVLLHACAHNPTGVDPTEAQWEKIADIVRDRNLVPILDSAYQGYASGDLEKDAHAVRLFEKRGQEMFMCQSFAKNLGLYGERIGMIHVTCATADDAKRTLSQMKLVIRPMYSSPPVHGALIVNKVLGNSANYSQWKIELKEMADRILKVRKVLRDGLEKKGTPGKWNHITDQIGMFSFTGLTKPQCERLIEKHHIFLLKTGRISLAGLNTDNIAYMVDAMDEVVRNA